MSQKMVPEEHSKTGDFSFEINIPNGRLSLDTSSGTRNLFSGVVRVPHALTTELSLADSWLGKRSITASKFREHCRRSMVNIRSLKPSVHPSRWPIGMDNRRWDKPDISARASNDGFETSGHSRVRAATWAIE